MKTRKELTWMACKEKKCCHEVFVIPTGSDVVRIARALDTPPWSFLMYFFTPEPRRDAFKLDHSGRYYRLALAKQPAQRKKQVPPCVFLLRTRQGLHRCGLGNLRPLVCRTFPLELSSGIVSVSSPTGCTCRVWSLVDVDLEEERVLLENRQREAEVYCRVVETWNSRVDQTEESAGFEFSDYCLFLLDALATVKPDSEERATADD